MSFYSDKFVRAGRKTKWCDLCGKTIQKGESAYSVPGENFEINHDFCPDCYKWLEQEGVDDIREYYGKQERLYAKMRGVWPDGRDYKPEDDDIKDDEE